MLHGDHHILVQLQTFMSDHQSLREEMDIIRGLMDDFEQQNEPSVKYLNELVVPVKHFYEQLEAHLLLEEKVLFPTLTLEIEEKGYLYFTFDLEHKQMKQHIKQFIFMADRYLEQLYEMEKQNMLCTLRFAIEAVEAHFEREEDILFPEILSLNQKKV